MSVAKLLKQFSKLTDEQKAEVMEYFSNDDDNTEEQKSNEQVDKTQEPQSKEDKSKPEVKQEPKQEPQPQPQPNPNPAPIVQEEEANDFKGIDISEVVLKGDLDERLNAMSAKLDAIIKENADLKDKLANSEKEKEDLHKKYEYDDFGNQAQKEYGKGDNSTPYQSADDYVKQFYNK